MNSISTDSPLFWPRKQVADLLVLVGCGAVGLALARWLDPYGYTNGYRATPGWVFAHGIAPAWIGIMNLGQAALLALHWFTRRRHPFVSTIEYCGTVTTGAFAALWMSFLLAVLLEYRSEGLEGPLLIAVLAVGLTMLLSAATCTICLLGRAAYRERLHWPELLALGAAIPTGLWLPYELITSLPVC